MRMPFIIFVLFATIFMARLSSGQYVSHYIEKDHIKSDTLIDKKTHLKFIIDKERIFITAIDSSGKILWKTDPYIDNKIEEYRVKRPTIVYFAFSERLKDAISIAYNNSQFGDIDEKTGKYHFHGQD